MEGTSDLPDLPPALETELTPGPEAHQVGYEAGLNHANAAPKGKSKAVVQADERVAGPRGKAPSKTFLLRLADLWDGGSFEALGCNPAMNRSRVGLS
ncbi:hypothetical protein NL676_039169 [Syzygium grande]|nr:hypothetical protein NL676_039169 [Syzygium grande]